MLPAKPLPNPNNNLAQAINSIELQTLPSYIILIVPVHEIQLRYGRLVNDIPKSSVIIREENEEVEEPNEIMNDKILQDVEDSSAYPSSVRTNSRTNNPSISGTISNRKTCSPS